MKPQGAISVVAAKYGSSPCLGQLLWIPFADAWHLLPPALAAAERIGVFAEPEVVTKQLQPSHAFMVLASDGVWEFLPSQSVVDMVSKFDDPQVCTPSNTQHKRKGQVQQGMF
jgi:serine/threonine protein phosphatase PrpC